MVNRKMVLIIFQLKLCQTPIYCEMLNLVQVLNELHYSEYMYDKEDVISLS